MGEVGEASDLLVVGGGPGGYVAALHAARMGRDVTLVERDGLGGACLRSGCIPSKMLLDTADIHHRAARLGLTSASCESALAAFQRDKRSALDDIEGGVLDLLHQRGVRVIPGVARFTARNRVAIERPGEQAMFLEFRHAIVATGSRPAPVPDLVVDGDVVLDSTTALELTEVPARLCVVGAGYIGVELATAFAKLGSAVVLLEAQDRVLPGMDRVFALPVSRGLEKLGVEVHVNVDRLERFGGSIRAGMGDAVVDIECDRVLVAVGRLPNTDDLGLDAAGARCDRSGRIIVGADRRAPGTAIAAIGDVVEGPPVAHKAIAEAEVAAAAVSGTHRHFAPAAIPLVVFSDPEVATAGLSREAAQAEGLHVSTSTVPLTAIGRARSAGEAHGFYQLVVDQDRDVVVGVHVVSPHAAEVIAAGVLAIEMAASPTDLAATIHAHPTYAEGIAEAAALAIGAPIHAPLRRSGEE